MWCATFSLETCNLAFVWLWPSMRALYTHIHLAAYYWLDNCTMFIVTPGIRKQNIQFWSRCAVTCSRYLRRCYLVCLWQHPLIPTCKSSLAARPDCTSSWIAIDFNTITEASWVVIIDRELLIYLSCLQWEPSWHVKKEEWDRVNWITERTGILGASHGHCLGNSHDKYCRRTHSRQHWLSAWPLGIHVTADLNFTVVMRTLWP